MANWLTPKTDWTVEDGVLNTDFNRIEGNLEYLYDNAASQVKNVLSYYVSTNGSDNNDGLTLGTAFATIQKAVDSIPTDLGGKGATIVIAPGTYPGFTMNGFSNGLLSIVGSTATADVYVSTAVIISNCLAVSIRSIGSFIAYGKFSITNVAGFLNSVDSVVSNSSGDALVVAQSCVAYTLSLTVTSSSSTSGIIADYNSDVYVESVLIMPGTGTGIRADRGAKFTYSSISNRATAGTFVNRGGRIYTGSLGSGVS